MSRDMPNTPPHSLDAEQSVIGGLMMLAPDSSEFKSVIESVKPSDFYRPDHQLIYTAVLNLVAEGSPVDYVTLYTAAESINTGIGSAHLTAYIGEMAKNTPSAANIKSYAKIVINASVRRQLIEINTNLIAAAYEPDFNDDAINTLMESATKAVFDLEQKRSSMAQGMKSLRPAIKDLLNNIQNAKDRAANGESAIRGLTTGYHDIDKRLGGLEEGKLYIVAGRPSMGKTTFAMNIVEAVAANYPELMTNVFSLEMLVDELAEKFLSSAGRANFGRLRNPVEVTDDDWVNISMGVKKLSKTNIYIDDSSTLTPNQIRQRLRTTIQTTGKKPGVVVVDFIQLMNGDAKRYDNRNTEIGEISRELKAIAKEFLVPVIALSQLNRGLEQRGNKRPILSDLRESGDLEQNANVIIFVHRESVYAQREGRLAELSHDEQRLAEIITGKVRGGVTGTDNLAFFGEYQRFDNYSPEVESPNGGAW